jgi:[amino group carrier protein]-L-2-aminoadipate 6-kinase
LKKSGSTLFKMIIVKIGGGEKINIGNITKDISKINDDVVVIHGGNYLMDSYGKKLGIEKKYLESPTGLKSRYTTEEVIDLMLLTYAGLANKKIVASLQKSGVNALGLSGLDGKMITGKKHDSLLALIDGKKTIIKDDLTGSVKDINADLLKTLLELGIVPVVTPPVMTGEGEVINVDGDKIAAAIAKELKAEKLIFLIEAPGVMKDLADEKSLIKKIEQKDLDKILESAQGRMKRKIMEIKKLLESGIKEVVVSDGRIENPLTTALKGGGTHAC